MKLEDGRECGRSVREERDRFEGAQAVERLPGRRRDEVASALRQADQRDRMSGPPCVGEALGRVGDPQVPIGRRREAVVDQQG